MTFSSLSIGDKFTVPGHLGQFEKASANSARNKYGCNQWFAPKPNACSMYHQEMTVQK